MKTSFDKSFLKNIEAITDQSLKIKISAIIKNVQEAQSLLDIHQLKKLKGYKTYYRIKSGDYRIGIEHVEQNSVRFIIIAHRKDIYKRFP